MATSIYLDIDQGSDYSMEIDLTNDDGTPMILTGGTLISQFRKHSTSKIHFDFNASIINATTGKILIELPGSVSSDIKPGTYVYDVKLIMGNAKFRPIEGILTINPEISKV